MVLGDIPATADGRLKSTMNPCSSDVVLHQSGSVLTGRVAGACEGMERDWEL